jgi:hypothetical protein
MSEGAAYPASKARHSRISGGRFARSLWRRLRLRWNFWVPPPPP